MEDKREPKEESREWEDKYNLWHSTKWRKDYVEKIGSCTLDLYDLDDGWPVKKHIQEEACQHCNSIRPFIRQVEDTARQEGYEEGKAEERERMVELVEKQMEVPPYSADKDDPIKHVRQNEGYMKACEELTEAIKGHTKKKGGGATYIETDESPVKDALDQLFNNEDHE